ncbi:hypothetical protein UFOVP884_15 [uncultured Caudovirales phage]|uniref:Gp6 domain containing protein n=1 Tax=uncultured Caudovirales phage TaxID=2100421 RepID=A0A6J5RDE3_9CAUD|nr:hypothetical protein UFOVP293_15 [uncultured Caudovirales phage]CAB4168629.1 hypothetical protein UFOVP884_15 [uncultured Caudovirales phage]CAB4195019.1 hypothetical protein UFOVP1275_17 [uncultured Caudovirales phage]CAB4204692.1 hypothetical protein UFOVP1401_13 [uncultured Caudovirales phage]
MATYEINFHQRIDNYAVVQTLTDNDVAVGESITVAGLGHGLNGTHTVYAQPQYLYLGTDSLGNLLFDASFPLPNQVMYYDEDAELERSAAIPMGTLTYTQTCTWVTAAQVMAYIGVTIDNPSDDYTLLTQATSASNSFCWRRRQESGYTGDSLSTSPSGDVTLGTLMYAAALWRARGSVQDTFASFDGMGSAGVSAMTPMIKQLLGIPRPQVA